MSNSYKSSLVGLLYIRCTVNTGFYIKPTCDIPEIRIAKSNSLVQVFANDVYLCSWFLHWELFKPSFAIIVSPL